MNVLVFYAYYGTTFKSFCSKHTVSFGWVFIVLETTSAENYMGNQLGNKTLQFQRQLLQFECNELAS